ncbi:unnamed protein product [Miscanthus lutarioriparius]|uniref:Pentatricopeptide repeat-containing protein n=1 Tax=Miscanthus lutarioriparius TaxID=422564 RepID=A0A811RWL4_9POAL|nr:unnamed protein product [Miscanthus lutarioriparius]
MAGKFPSDHLSAALLRETDPAAALRLFLNPPNATLSAPFRYSLRCYDLIISKLAAARLFSAMESILSCLPPAVPSSVCRDAGISPNECTYNILMRAAAAAGSLEHVRHLFDEMLLIGVSPTVTTFGIMVAALCDADKLEQAFEVKEAMVRRYNVSPNASLYASLIKGLCQRQKVDAAMRLKDEMAGNAELVRVSAVYGTLVRALFQVGRKDEVVGLLKEMKEREIVPHRVVFNAMIAGLYEDERDPGAALAVLDDMQKKHRCKPDGASYSTLVAGLCKLGKWRDAIELVKDMPRRGFPPDVVTYRMLFDGLCAAGEFHEANKVLGDMTVKGFAPRMDGARKFVEGVEKEGDALLLEVLCSLAKVNALESGGWEKAVGGVFNDRGKLRLEKQLESIRFT